MSEISPVFAITVRVYIEDTDAGGIVFYANYLKYFERARTEKVRSLGYALRSGLEQDVSFVVADLQVKYLKPARLEDVLLITAEVEDIKGASILFRQRVYRCEPDARFSGEVTPEDIREMELLVEAQVKVASLSLSTMQLCRLPAELKQALAK